jgi:hypothetical protein
MSSPIHHGARDVPARSSHQRRRIAQKSQSCLYPEGMYENSPRFQPWDNTQNASKVPKGRLKGIIHRAWPRFSPFKTRLIPAIILLICVAVRARAEVHVLNDPPQHVFSGPDQKISLKLQNSGNSSVDLDLRARFSQVSSATAAPLNTISIKTLRILPGQTILESAQFTFPSVRAETPFIIQWLDGTNKVIGTSSVLVYAPDLLKQLKALAGDEAVGLFDPNDRLKSSLKRLNIESADLEDSGLDHFEGKLAILGPFQSKEQLGENATMRVRALAERGTGVVWILLSPRAHAPLKPSFYTVMAGKGAIVVVQPTLVANLPDNPEAQRNLIALAKLAVHPEVPKLPELTDATTDN